MSNSNFVKLLLFFILFCTNIKAQEINERWSFGLNSSSVLYSAEDADVVGGRYIAIIPGISVSKYLGEKMTISVTFSKAFRDVQKYFSSDINLSYDLFKPEGILRPYLLAGIGAVNLLDTSFTLNVGAGGTLWLFNRLGLNGQLVYKMLPLGGDFQRPHFFGSAGIVFSIDFSGSKRIWERNR